METWHVEADAFERLYDPSDGEDESWYINDHTFVRDGEGTWHMFGITHAEPAAPHQEVHLAHATAPRLHGSWTKQPFALTADPDVDESVLWAPHVIEHDGVYWMFVCGGGPSTSEFRIHLATSPDLWTWTRHAENPLVVDGYEARDPMVQRVDDRWVMYYTATETPTGGHHVVASLASDDLVHWRDRRVVYVDPIVGGMGGPTESPFIVERRGRWFLLIGPDWQGMLDEISRSGKWDPAAYRRTRVIASDDPFHFELSDQVGVVDAHAAEVIVDDDGSCWVSHCGWGQGGLYLARLPQFDL